MFSCEIARVSANTLPKFWAMSKAKGLELISRSFNL